MIDALTDPQTMILAVAVIGAFATILMLGLPLMATDNLSSRLKKVAKRREELSAAQQKSKELKQSSIRLQQGKGYMRSLVDRFRLVNPTESTEIRNMLAQAGMRGQGPVITYAFFRFVAPIILGILTLIYFFLLAKTEMSVLARLGITAGAMVVGFFLPTMIVKNGISKRQLKLSRGFPNALDLMVICVEAGLSMEASFQRVADEIQGDFPEMAEEIGLTTAELAFLPDRASALSNLSDRTGLESIKNLTTALAQAEKYGTPISVSLKVISQESRDERMSKAEKKAGALPAQLTVPMIAFFLPVLFVVILVPAIIKSMAAMSK